MDDLLKTIGDKVAAAAPGAVLGSTFLFGELTLTVDSKGVLRAKGNFNGAVGPAWWGVRNRRPTT